MGTIEAWARLKTAADVPIRLGAWYRVVSHTALEAVLSVEGGKSIAVPRPYLDIRAAPPREWTVLRSEAVPLQAPELFRLGYIVCPGCQKRVPLPAAELADQMCPRCNNTFPIAWNERYPADRSR